VSPFPALPTRSLGWRLLAPVVLTWAALAVVGVAGLSLEAERRLEQSMVRRAEVLANLINYSAESVTHLADLRRFVQKAAAEPNVVAIVVAAGSPARVVASSRAAWHGRLVSEIGDAAIADDISTALRQGGVHHHFHAGERRFDYGAALLLSLPTITDAALTEGAVAIELDTRTLQADIRRSTTLWITGILLGSLALTLSGYRLLQRLVLGPLRAVARAVEQRREDDDLAWAPADTGDELGTLARTLRESIRARTRTETALRLSERMASVGTLAGGVAHEIHTPLQFVNDSVHFLREAADDAVTTMQEVRAAARAAAGDTSPDRLRKALGAIVARIDEADLDDLSDRLPGAAARSSEGVERVEGIVRSLKACADPAPGDLELDDVNRAVKNAVTVVARECGAFAAVDFRPDDLPRVRCRAGDVYEAVLHVLHNAADAVARRHGRDGQHGRILVRTAREGDDVVITVADNGDGIASAIADRVFDPFFTTKDVGRGFGQGLAIAWRLVTERHGGQIGFTCPPGGGTAFTVRLPIAGPAVSRHEGRAA